MLEISSPLQKRSNAKKFVKFTVSAIYTHNEGREILIELKFFRRNYIRRRVVFVKSAICINFNQGAKNILPKINRFRQTIRRPEHYLLVQLFSSFGYRRVVDESFFCLFMEKMTNYHVQ